MSIFGKKLAGRFLNSEMDRALNEYQRCLNIYNEISGVVAVYGSDGQKIVPDNFKCPEGMTVEAAIEAREQEVVKTWNMVSAELDMAYANIQLVLAKEKFGKGETAKTPISSRQITLNY